MHQRFLPQITLDEVNKMAKEWFPDQNRLVIVSAPEKSGLVIPDEQKLAAVVKAASGRELTAFVDTVSLWAAVRVVEIGKVPNAISPPVVVISVVTPSVDVAASSPLIENVSDVPPVRIDG